jgi:hypothetical protein
MRNVYRILVDRIHLTQDKNQWQALVNMIMDL